MKASLLLSLGLLLAILASPSTTAKDENANLKEIVAASSLPETTERLDLPGNSTETTTTDLPENSTETTTPDLPENSIETTTPDLPGNSTETTTPDLPGNSTETTTPDLPGNSTETPETPDPAGNSTQPSMTTESPGGVSSQTTSPDSHDHCKREPCGGSASCVNLLSERFCLCSEGSYYKEPSCVKGKTFPGEIGVKLNETTNLEDKTSPAYQDLYSKVVEFFQKAFNAMGAGSDYGQTIILKVSVSSSQSTRSAMRTASETIVSVVNMFNKNTSLNESTITKAIQDEVVKDNNMYGYTGQDLCDFYGCVKNDEGCQDPLQCTCRSGLTRPNLQVHFCLPLECPRSCRAEEKKQCLKNGNGALECVCMPGYQNSIDNKCEACPFGYSGQDCKDPFLLILTIVGTIGGALILILLIAFIVSVSSKNQKNVEEQKLIDEDFQNVRMQQTGFSNSGFSNSGFSNNSDFSNFRAGNSIFPKVKTQNPYAHQRSMPHPDY